MDKIEIILPIQTVSEANVKEHWSKSHRRHIQQQRTLRIYLSHITEFPMPCVVTWTRLGGRKLDEGDNLRMAFKWLVDELADILFGNVYQEMPKKAIYLPAKRLKGRQDTNPLVEWRYAQEGAFLKGTRLTIEFKEKNDNSVDPGCAFVI